MEALLEWVKVLLSFAGPILVVIVTVRGERSKRVEDAEKKLEQQQTEAREKELKETITGFDRRIAAMEEAIRGMDGRIDKIKSFGKETRDNVRDLANYYAMNSHATRELAELVMVMGEGLRDQHLDGNITQAIARYRKHEKEALDKFMTTPPEIDDD